MADAEEELTRAVQRARRGFRSDVAALVAAMTNGSFLVPLARGVAGVPEGQDVEIEEVTISPHLVPDELDELHVALFTDVDILELAAAHLKWKTDGGELLTCTLPSAQAFEMALDLIDHAGVVGLVINPGDEAELLLSRAEAASLLQGRALPLVGYVQQIPEQADEESLVSELDAPLNAELLADLERCVSLFPAITGYRMEQTFNAERDVEPHLTLRLIVNTEEADFDGIGRTFAEHLDQKLPPPGYIDVLFEMEEGEEEQQ